MGRNEETARNLSNRALISEITDRATLLAKKELELAKAEIRADLKSELAMAKALGVAAVVALTGLNPCWRSAWRFPAGWRRSLWAGSCSPLAPSWRTSAGVSMWQIHWP